MANLDHKILGKMCIVFIKDTEQVVVYKNKAMKMASTVEGMLTKIDKDFIYLSPGSSDETEKIVPVNSIGYIHIEPGVDSGMGLFNVSDVGGDDGIQH